MVLERDFGEESSIGLIWGLLRRKIYPFGYTLGVAQMQRLRKAYGVSQ